MPNQTESIHAGEFLITEANGDLSREEITIVSGQNLVAGAVLGKITASGKYKAYDDAAVDGSQAAAGILFDAVDASAADAKGVGILRHAEVDGDMLNWASQNAGQITNGITDLLALQITIR
jgi:head decoration protein D